MTPRTLTRPLDDASYWRRLLATVHPDRDGGDAELFVFFTALKEHVEGCRAVEPLYGGETASGPRPSSAPTERREHDEPDRVPYDPDYGGEDNHLMLTRRALSIAQELEEPL